jgi:hypothetical protein
MTKYVILPKKIKYFRCVWIFFYENCRNGLDFRLIFCNQFESNLIHIFQYLVYNFSMSDFAFIYYLMIFLFYNTISGQTSIYLCIFYYANLC